MRHRAIVQPARACVRLIGFWVRCKRATLVLALAQRFASVGRKVIIKIGVVIKRISARRPLDVTLRDQATTVEAFLTIRATGLTASTCSVHSRGQPRGVAMSTWQVSPPHRPGSQWLAFLLVSTQLPRYSTQNKIGPVNAVSGPPNSPWGWGHFGHLKKKNPTMLELTATIGARVGTTLRGTRVADLRSVHVRLPLGSASNVLHPPNGTRSNITYDAAQPLSLARRCNACARLSPQAMRGVEAARRALRRSGLLLRRA